MSFDPISWCSVPRTLRSLEMLVALSPCHQDPRITYFSDSLLFGGEWHSGIWVNMVLLEMAHCCHRGGMRAQLAPENPGKERVENIQCVKSEN